MKKSRDVTLMLMNIVCIICKHNHDLPSANIPCLLWARYCFNFRYSGEQSSWSFPTNELREMFNKHRMMKRKKIKLHKASEKIEVLEEVSEALVFGSSLHFYKCVVWA